MKFCITAHIAGTYMIKYPIFGSLARLFPGSVKPTTVKVAVGRPFKIRMPLGFYGSTYINQEWSDRFQIQIDRIPRKKKFETEIVLTPIAQGIQFSPTQIIWSANLKAQTRARSFKLRPMIDCALEPVPMLIRWDIQGMKSRVVPIRPTKIRVKQFVKTPGCMIGAESENTDPTQGSTNSSETQQADEEYEEFEELYTSDKSINNTALEQSINETESELESGDLIQGLNSEHNKQNDSLPWSYAVALLGVFGAIILGLCAFGFLGKDEEFELIIANQIRQSILRKQQQVLKNKMKKNASTIHISSHYIQNKDRKYRFMAENYLYGPASN